MTVEHHALVIDLPEYREAIHELKVSDAHFARLMEAYHTLTSEIEKLENAGGSTSDEVAHGLKSQRVKLKDELMAMLEAKACNDKDGGCCGSCGG